MFVKRALTLFLVFTFLLPMTAFSGRLSEAEELDRVIKRLTNASQEISKCLRRRLRRIFLKLKNQKQLEPCLKSFHRGMRSR